MADLGNNGVKIEHINFRAFQGNQKLKNIDLEGIRSIGSECFKNCSELKSVVNAGELREIRYCAFENCSKLETVSDADNVEMIENKAFANTPWYDKNKAYGLVRLGSVLLYYKTDSDTIDLTTGALEGIKTIRTGSMLECKNAITLKVPHDSVFESSCMYVAHAQTGKGESVSDPMPENCTYKIKNV